ncbi:MAG: glycosyltransferase family 4 protein [Planctomycetota bacterium]|nr:glycosyltransferase family 4 protein [Planctomycetota bacterium]
MRILITNFSLANRTGTELYVYDLCLELLKRGHHPVVYSPILGPLAEKLLARTIPVVDSLADLGAKPDLIHGHHGHPMMTALCHFPNTPAIYVLHDWGAWQDQPPKHPRILRYIAVDETCLDRLIARSGVPEDQTEVIGNFVDLARFQPRETLPVKATKALMFSNYMGEGGEFDKIKEACRRENVELEILGASVGRCIDNPEAILGRYDIVLGKGKSAMEAMAVGCAVVLCDVFGQGPMVTSDEFPRLRRLNFGRRSLLGDMTVDSLTAELKRYNAEDAALVSKALRAQNSLDSTVTQLLELYKSLIGEFQAESVDREAESKALALYLSKMEGADTVAYLKRKIERLEKKQGPSLAKGIRSFFGGSTKN